MNALIFTPSGIYCPAGDFYIDPWRAVPRALITHGHADHARLGMEAYLATDIAGPVIRYRLGNIALEEICYGETRQIGGAKVSFHPAGHVLGSAQIRVEVMGEVWVVSGDYKIIDDGLSTPFETIRCHHFITESTFGLPVFHWPNQNDVSHQINDWWSHCAKNNKTAFLGCYSLGKAQRLLTMLDPSIGPILTHTAIDNTNQVIREQGIKLPNTFIANASVDPKNFSGAIVLAPPSAIGSNWSRRYGAQETALASGWMTLRGVRRRHATDRGFVISDHADWPGLLEAIKNTGAENVYVTHGYSNIFAQHLSNLGWNAKVLQTEFGTEIEKETS